MSRGDPTDKAKICNYEIDENLKTSCRAARSKNQIWTLSPVALQKKQQEEQELAKLRMANIQPSITGTKRKKGGSRKTSRNGSRKTSRKTSKKSSKKMAGGRKHGSKKGSKKSARKGSKK